MTTIPRNTALQRDLEVLALAHVAHALVTHFVERAVDGLALRIENSLLQRDVNVGFHGWNDYKSRGGIIDGMRRRCAIVRPQC